jgi:phage-related tail fiber protein
VAAVPDESVTTAKLANDAVTFAKMQNIATAVILGRSTAGTGDVEALTSAQATALLLDAGLVIHVAMNTAPTGFLKANGALVSRTSYAALFAAIGTTFGVGDGSTTFALPDLRGEFLRGWDDGRGVDAGRVFGSAQSGAIQSHTHTATGSDVAGGFSGSFGPGNGTNVWQNGIGSTGGAETRPRNIALLACIKF